MSKNEKKENKEAEETLSPKEWPALAPLFGISLTAAWSDTGGGK